jgi:hypothetical protein
MPSSQLPACLSSPPLQERLVQELEKAVSKRAMISIKSAALKQKQKALANEAEAAAKRSLAELQRSIREADKQVGRRVPRRRASQGAARAQQAARRPRWLAGPGIQCLWLARQPGSQPVHACRTGTGGCSI